VRAGRGFKGSGIGVGRAGESGRWPVVHSWCLDGGALRIGIGALDGFICDNAKFIMPYKVYYALPIFAVTQSDETCLCAASLCGTSGVELGVVVVVVMST
jgi:hypothetical protein